MQQFPLEAAAVEINFDYYYLVYGGNLLLLLLLLLLGALRSLLCSNLIQFRVAQSGSCDVHQRGRVDDITKSSTEGEVQRKIFFFFFSLLLVTSAFILYIRSCIIRALMKMKDLQCVTCTYCALLRLLQFKITK